MRRAFVRHRRDLLAVVVMAALGLTVLGYILLRQPAFQAPGWLDSNNKDLYTFKAEFYSAPAIVAGQGQTVNIAGVPVGDVKSIELENGRAVLEFEIERRYAPIFRDATLLLRPRTPLKDMYLALEPGTKDAGALPEGGRLPVAQTLPDVNYDEILGNLDADTRSYLKLLLAGASEGLGDKAGDGSPDPAAVDDLRGTYKRFEPLARDARELYAGLARRRKSLRRAVGAFEQIAVELGRVDRDLAGLVDAADTTFQAVAAQDANLRESLAELPGALQQTETALTGVTGFADRLRPVLSELRPFARDLGPGLSATRPLLLETTPVIRDQLRPFSRDVQPVVAELRPAATDLAGALPPLVNTLRFVNRFFNALAYNPPGSEEGYLFWGAWLSHIGPSLLTAQDAHGATPRTILFATCAQLDALHQVELGNPSLGPILRLLNAADRLKVCPGSTP